MRNIKKEMKLIVEDLIKNIKALTSPSLWSSSNDPNQAKKHLDYCEKLEEHTKRMEQTKSLDK